MIDVSKLLIGRLTSGTKKRWWCYYGRNVFTTEERVSRKGVVSQMAFSANNHVQLNTGRADSRLVILGTIKGGGMVTDFVIQPYFEKYIYSDRNQTLG